MIWNNELIRNRCVRFFLGAGQRVNYANVPEPNFNIGCNIIWLKGPEYPVTIEYLGGFPPGFTLPTSITVPLANHNGFLYPVAYDGTEPIGIYFGQFRVTAGNFQTIAWVGIQII